MIEQLGMLLLVGAGLLPGGPSVTRTPVRTTSVEVLLPGRGTTAKVGTPLTIAWRIRNAPSHPEDWEIHVELRLCPLGSSDRDVYVAPLTSARTSIKWLPTREFVESLPCDGKCDPVTISVCLYNRREAPFEVVPMHHTCHAVMDRPAADPEVGDESKRWFICAYSSGAVVFDRAKNR